MSPLPFLMRKSTSFTTSLFSRSAVSDSLQPNGQQHARLLCPSPTPRACSNSCHQVSDSTQPSHPLSSPLLPPLIFPSIRVFPNESVLCIRWPKYWSFSFSISPSSEHSGLISFRMDWLDLLAVQGTLKSLLQHHSSKASILQHSGGSPSWFLLKCTSPNGSGWGEEALQTGILQSISAGMHLSGVIQMSLALHFQGFSRDFPGIE